MGVHVVLPAEDPAWDLMTQTLTVAFTRLDARLSLTLTGSGPTALAQYVEDCNAIATLGPNGGIAPAAAPIAQDGYLSCDNLDLVASRDAGRTTELTFANRTLSGRAIIWIDGSGVPVGQTFLNANKQTTYTTGPGHVWAITDAQGNCVELVHPVVGQAEYLLRQ